MIAKDGHDQIALRLTLAGRSSGEAEDRAVSTGHGDLLAFDLARPLVMVDEGPQEGISVSFRRDLFETESRRLPSFTGWSCRPSATSCSPTSSGADAAPAGISNEAGRGWRG